MPPCECEVGSFLVTRATFQLVNAFSSTPIFPIFSDVMIASVIGSSNVDSNHDYTGHGDGDTVFDEL